MRGGRYKSSWRIFNVTLRAYFNVRPRIMHAGEIISKLCKFSEFSASPQFIRSIVVHGSRVRKCFNLFRMKDKKIDKIKSKN